MGTGASGPSHGSDVAVKAIDSNARDTPNIQFATMKFNKKAKFSETHHLWTTNERLLNELPPPHPPYTRKYEIFDPVAYKHVDKKACKIPEKEMHGSLKEMVGHLILKCHDDISKIRAIYVWLTSLNLAKFKLPLKATKEGTAINYIEKLKKKKETYAQMISRMCNIAGLNCVVIHGYLKGNTYEIGRPMSTDKHYGEWNAVLIDNNWRFINAFWGACSFESGVEESDMNSYKCDENFFLTDPEQLAYTHYPMEPKWQLLEPPKSLKEFETKAFLKERFFELGMRVLSHPKCEFQVDKGEVEILFGVNPGRAKNLKFMALVYINEDKGYNLIYDDKNRSQQDFICFPNDNSVKVRIRFPKAATYRVEIVGKDTSIDHPGYDYDWVAIYKANVKSGHGKCSAFPKCAEAGWGNSKIFKEVGLRPSSKMDNGIVTTENGHCRLSFKFENPQAKEIQLTYKVVDVNCSLDEAKLERDGLSSNRDEFYLKLNVPSGEEMAFCLFAQVDDETYGSVEKNLCNYLIMSIPARQVDEKANSVVTDGKTILKDAIRFKQLELIERAIDLVETRRHEGHMQKELNEAKRLARRLRKVSKLMHDVLALNQNVITEIREKTHPPQAVHDTMKATFLLLGNYESETKDWKAVQALLGKTGRQSLKRRINMFDINHCKLEIALGAKFLIKDVDMDDVQSENKGVATFYTWVKGIIEEMEHRFSKEEIKRTIPKINNS